MRSVTVLASLAAGLAFVAHPVAAQDTDDDAVHEHYKAVLAEYEALKTKADNEFTTAMTSTDRDSVCSHYQAGLDTLHQGIAKADELIAIMKSADVDSSDNENVRTQDLAIVDDRQKDYDDACNAPVVASSDDADIKRYQDLTIEYHNLRYFSDAAFADAQTAMDRHDSREVTCGHFDEGLKNLKAAMDKLDEMIAIAKAHGEDTSDDETALAGYRDTADQEQSTFDNACSS